MPLVKNAESFFSPYLTAARTLSDKVSFDGGLRYNDSEQFGSDVSPEGGLVFALPGEAPVRVRGGKAFRVPRVDDVDAPFGVPNEDLLPEELAHAERGVNKPFGRGSEIDVAGWWMDGDNLIQSTSVGGLTLRENTGRFTHKGLEASLRVRVVDELTLRFGAGIQDLDGDSAQVPERTFDFGFDPAPARRVLRAVS